MGPRSLPGRLEKDLRQFARLGEQKFAMAAP